jgi:outer membrane lipoprotein-sorting protein
MKAFKLLFILVLFTMHFSAVNGQSAASLLRSMDELMSAPKDKESNVEMILTDKSGKEKIRKATLKQKGPYKRLYRYTYPEKQIGVATLSMPDDIIWLYMPAFKKAVKITLLSKSQAFTGTDFSYEDMSGTSYEERYTPRILDDSDPKVYKLELMPKSMKTKYSKIILYLNKEYYYPQRMEYYDSNKKHFKNADYEYVKKGKYWYAEKVLMTNINKNHSTEIRLTDMKFDQGLSDEEFTVENLKPLETAD